MITDTLDINAEEFHAGTGWEIKPQGACKGEVCVPLPGGYELQRTSDRLGMALVSDPAHRVWALGPESLGGHALVTAQAPDFELPDLDGHKHRLSDYRGRKVLLASWASW